jgi:hypothetical protein
LATVQTRRTKRAVRVEPCDDRSLERGVRQLLADKVSGTQVGLWLLAPEHVRLGTWDLLCAWTGRPPSHLDPRLALQLVHEAALCTTGIRRYRSLSQKGFELANGLPFIATDQAVHQMLERLTVAQAQDLQIALGKIRRARDHFRGQLLAIDPHRMRSWSQRQMCRQVSPQAPRPVKTAQLFFCLDAETHQPLAFTIGSSARTVAQATPDLLRLAADILQGAPGPILVVADTEHYAADLVAHVADDTPFDLLLPMPNRLARQAQLRAIPPDQFTRHRAGFATTHLPFAFSPHGPHYTQLVQRCGESPNDTTFKAFLCTANRDELQSLTADYPQRWHVEEFFNADQALGWNRAGTLNLHIRYGALSMALIAQTALHQLRQRLGLPFLSWDAQHLADHLLAKLDGDIRVLDDTILVTFYNAPNPDRLRAHYQGLPHILRAEGLDPHIPWLYNFQLDFRFK